MPLNRFNAFMSSQSKLWHTYSSTGRDKYERKNREGESEKKLFQTIRQQNGIGRLYHIDKIYDCLQWPPILGERYIICICNISVTFWVRLTWDDIQSCTVKAPYKNKLITLPTNCSSWGQSSCKLPLDTCLPTIPPSCNRTHSENCAFQGWVLLKRSRCSTPFAHGGDRWDVSFWKVDFLSARRDEAPIGGQGGVDIHVPHASRRNEPQTKTKCCWTSVSNISTYV